MLIGAEGAEASYAYTPRLCHTPPFSLRVNQRHNCDRPPNRALGGLILVKVLNTGAAFGLSALRQVRPPLGMVNLISLDCN